jgi:DnaK suppressor protein
VVSKETLLSLEQLLVIERERLLAQIDEAKRSATAREEVLKDDGAESYEQERAVSLAAGLQPSLQEVDRALQKIGEGTYGICDGCGGDIPLERLQVLPQANLCVQCKSKQAKNHH